MSRRVLLGLILTASISAMAQYATIGPNGAVTTMNGNGLATGGNVVVIAPGAGGAVLTTPSATFATPPPTAGISMADRAGISQTAPVIPAGPSTESSMVLYSNSPQVQVVAPTVPASNVAPGPNEVAAEVNSGQAADNGARPLDLGPSQFAGDGSTIAVGSAQAVSLGEIAAKYKASHPQNIRTYTNADAQRLSDSINFRGANTAPVSAQNAPANALPQQAAQAQSSTATAGTTPSTQPQLMANAKPSPAIGVSPGEGASSQASPSATQSTAGAQSSTDNATTPQVNQAKPQQGNEQESGNRLPATSTLLPLLGLLGAVSGGLGLWFRKFRR